jgi:hypothetical protein
MFHLSIEGLLVRVGLSSGDDPYNAAFGSIAVDHHKQSKALAQAKENKSIFFFGVIRVIDQQCALVREDGLRILEGDLVLPEIDLGLLGIPLEADGGHAAIVRTLY